MFGFHDLLRAYATELVSTHDSDAERRATRQRVLDHYLHTAHAANLLLHPRYPASTITTAAPGVTSEEIADGAAALAWFEAEYAVLLAAVQFAADTGHHRHAWHLPHELTEFFLRRGHWADWAATERTALRAAQRHGDRHGQAYAHRSLGRALAWLGCYDEAHDHLHQAVVLSPRLATQSAKPIPTTGSAACSRSRATPPTPFPTPCRRSTCPAPPARRERWRHNLDYVGWFHTLLGEPGQGLIYSRQALTVNREVGDRWGEASTLDSIGYAHHLLGQYQQAIDH